MVGSTVSSDTVQPGRVHSVVLGTTRWFTQLRWLCKKGRGLMELILLRGRNCVMEKLTGERKEAKTLALESGGLIFWLDGDSPDCGIGFHF